MTNDPVCGLTVDETKTRFKSTHEDQQYFFCSQACQALFDQNPAKYLSGAEKAPASHRKVVVVGAGQVGATFAYALMMSGLASNIVLIDQNADLAEGQAMDLGHGLPFAPPAAIHAGTHADCKDADVVVVTAGAAQKPGETRLDLVRKNTAIFQDLIPSLTRHDPKILLIVANPVDVLTYVALKVSGYPPGRVIGSGTSLDTARFRSLLSRHCRVDARNVHAYIIGEHGDSEVPVWSQVNIGGIDFRDFCPTCQRQCNAEEKAALFANVKNAAYLIIDKKGYTNFGIGLALLRIVGAILRDENSVLTVSTWIDDFYGVSDVCLSIPVIVGGRGVTRRLHLGLDEAEIQELQESAEVLKEVIGQLKLW